MTTIKPSSHGIVVELKGSGLYYASHDRNFDPKTERKVRDLKPGESVLSYGVKVKDTYDVPLPDPEDSPTGDPDAPVHDKSTK